MNDSFFINDFELVKLTTTTPEYQYNLKDHLGNVRMTFTAKRETDLSLATVEDANYTNEQSKFLNYDKAPRINSVIFDHTNDGITPTPSSSYAIRLNGSDKEKIGLAKSLSVMPGDTLKIGVYAKYYKPYTANPTIAFTVLMKAIIDGMTPGGTFVDGSGYSGAPATLPFTDGFGKSTAAEEVPKAYLNWLIFDRNYVPIMSQSGFKQITVAAREDTTNSAHEHMKPPTDIIVAQAGYAYIWLSNENPSPVEVYFDDFKVEHIKSLVIQSQEYYPGGLTYNSYSKENSAPMSYLYNCKELQDELGLDWLHYGARMYMRDILRWSTGDPLADKYLSSSPYSYVANNFPNAIDPDGKRVFFVAGAGNDQIGWDYVERWGRAFQQTGITGFTRLNVSHDNPADLKNGGLALGDMNFTAQFRGSRNETYLNSNTNMVQSRRMNDKMVSKAVTDINENLRENPLAEGEQLNLAGYSYGSVVQTHAALSLADQGKKIDNLVLIGSPISSDSDLFKELSNHENIGNVIRVDIDKDLLSDPQGMDFLRGVLQNVGIDGAHFDLARPGKETDKKIQKTTDNLKKKGVK